MYKVITADDEHFVLEGLELMVDWKGCGFEPVASADDGRKAYELIKQLKPDLAVLDIHMPELSGIDIARRVKEEGIDCQVMMLTAYADVEHARECLKYGVKHYAVKPIAPEEIHEALADYKKILDRQTGRRALVEEQVKNGIKSEGAKKCVIAAAKGNSRNIAGGTILDHAGGIITYLVTGDAELFFKELVKNDSSIIGCCISGNDTEQCRRAAVSSLIRILCAEPGKLYSASGHGSNKITASDFGRFADRLNESIDFGDEKAALSVIDEFFSLLPDCAYPLQYARAFYAYMDMRLEREEVKLSDEDDLSERTETEKINELNILADFYNTVSDMCRIAISRVVRQRTDSAEGSFEIIEKYIREHFREQIVIKDLAKLIYTSPGYLGTVFTKKKGVSIKEYIHSLRLEEAVRLMTEDRDRPISDIAYAVGYNNYNHFFLRFEKRFGMPPLEYKKLFNT
ncbi:MAG: response regulator [Candidatus Ornithomonoglobus sp.]